jgi:acetylornithine/N-succinyldiaminopimelate aminotransferase
MKPATTSPQPPATQLPPWTAVMLPNYATPELVLARGEGAYVWDTEGKRYLDLVAGVAVHALGHAHPAVVAAVRDQVGTLVHSSNLYANEPALRLAAKLQSLMGGHKALLVNSGTEANEVALKLMRRHARATGRSGGVVVAFEKSFHGRTLGALALTGQPKHQDGFAPLPGQIVHVPFNDPSALEAACGAHDVVGVMAECVQGEGGVHPMQKENAAMLQRLAHAHGAILAIDEVQTGIARTGRMFSFEHFGLKPDVVTLAKGLGGGIPIGAMLASPKHAELLPPGSHGCTFGGNPVAAAAALATLGVVEKDDLAQRAQRLGQAAMQRVQGLRGLGLLLGMPVADGGAAKIKAAMQKEGVLVGVAGPDVVRLAPPLIVPEDAWMQSLGRLDELRAPA